MHIFIFRVSNSNILTIEINIYAFYFNTFMDILRSNVKKLLNAIPNPVLERVDIDELLDGRIDELIEKHRNEDRVFTETLENAELEPIDDIIADINVPITDKPSVNAKEDMADNGVIDTQQYTIEMAQQIITAFEQNYDEQTVRNIEDLRRKKSKKARREVREFDEALAIVLQLKTQHNI